MRLEIRRGIAADNARCAFSDMEEIEQQPGQAFRLIRDDAPMQAARVQGIEQFQHTGKDASVATKIPLIVTKKFLAHGQVIAMSGRDVESDSEHSACAKRCDRA